MNKDSVQWANENLAYKFQDVLILDHALTHPSASPHHQKNVGLHSFERMEFLGDRVLSMVMAQWLYELYPAATEDILSKRLTLLVRREALAQIARNIDLDQVMKVSRLNDNTSLRQHDTILSDGMEAVIASVYLDGGMASAQSLIRQLWLPLMDDQNQQTLKDPKSTLQEYSQKLSLGLPIYEVIHKTGSDHCPEFEIVVKVGQKKATGKNFSKKLAEQDAALALLKQLQDPIAGAF